MRSVVTGGAGFIGSHLVERLLAEGSSSVLVIDNLSTGSESNLASDSRISLEPSSIEDPKLESIFKAFKPELVFHLAAQASVVVSVRDPMLDARVNVLGMLNVLSASSSCGSRKVLFASSGGTVYGEPPASALPVPETYAGVPTSPYGITKKVTHDYLAFYRAVHGTDFTALALANVYGPRQDPHGEAGVIAIWSQAMLAGKECVVFGDGEQTRDFVYVTDVADAFIRASHSNASGEIVNIGTGVQTTVNDLYRQMAKTLSIDAPAKHEAPRAGELRHIALAIAKAKRLMGWEPKVSLGEGIAQTTAWFASGARGPQA
ncbi:MAG: NAD-dependent epimerase/dehydratase family protein [Actinomycetota bacterium]